ncbi:DUF6745 domain-containing protein [Actinomadura rayongensis]|uniref:DUF6745 domain-containing protein n=1 Tax=Actinomadura rayongensis TaxID=1429076 RepID=A0A6I4WIR4_9ACTN|nr:hypothetical protein [Actinomadura rayongensis]MXQ66532.1 hypothetical protein [Actinomadura rayongensis]
METVDRASLLLSWQAVAFATGAADRPAAEAGVAAAYAAAGLPAPERFVWVGSPAAGAVAAAALGGHADALRAAGLDVPDLPAAGASVRDAVRTRPWEQVRAQAHAALGTDGWPRAWADTGALLWDPVNSVVTRVRAAIGGLAEPVETVLRAATLDAVLGQQDAPWLAQFDALDLLEPLRGLAGAARSAGWWWPYENLVIIAERPVELHRDEPGRLHRGDGPAVAWPDGFALHAWRGMPIPADFVRTLDGLTPERIRAEDNAELRRVMLEIYGYDRYLAESNATPLHRDETGVLWRIDLPDDEPVVMVEVVNSTPEPDGTSRTYYLRVPPATRTAREGVAWTFGVDAADYHPQAQT